MRTVRLLPGHFVLVYRPNGDYDVRGLEPGVTIEEIVDSLRMGRVGKHADAVFRDVGFSINVESGTIGFAAYTLPGCVS